MATGWTLANRQRMLTSSNKRWLLDRRNRIIRKRRWAVVEGLTIVHTPPKGPTCQMHATQCQETTSVKNRDIPLGIVGDQAITPVYIDGHDSSCLLDTGSQVTCATETFHTGHLPHRKLQPLSHLAVIGAAGQSVPYKGYIELTLNFPAKSAGTQKEITTLAPCNAPTNEEKTMCHYSLGPTPVLYEVCSEHADKQVQGSSSRSSLSMMYGQRPTRVSPTPYRPV